MILKKDKSTVDYSRGKPDAHCALCQHFRSPDRCALVRGTISPSMWCRLFKRKGPDAAA